MAAAGGLRLPSVIAGDPRARKRLHLTREAIKTLKNPHEHQEYECQNLPRRRPRGAFWPTVRERMQRKAVELYMHDHPETENKPEMEELKEAGYMRMAKILVLRESRLQDQP